MPALAHAIGLAVLAAGLALVPFFSLNDFYLQILFTIGVNYLAAAGLNVLVGYAGQKSLGHAGLFAVGAYTAAIANIEWGLSPGCHCSWPAASARSSAWSSRCRRCASRGQASPW